MYNVHDIADEIFSWETNETVFIYIYTNFSVKLMGKNSHVYNRGIIKYYVVALISIFKIYLKSE